VECGGWDGVVAGNFNFLFSMLCAMMGLIWDKMQAAEEEEGEEDEIPLGRKEGKGDEVCGCFFSFLGEFPFSSS